MDSITHIALGACIGGAFFEKKPLGKKALLWGALAQSVPDIDFIAAFWLDPTSNLIAHRGFTHSLLFASLIGLFLALVAEKWHRPHNITFKKWVVFFYLQILVHLMLDGLNNYGIGWFEPFSHARISFNVIYVADPFFSIWPGIALLVLLFMKRESKRLRFWLLFGLVPSMLYLVYCAANKLYIDNEVRTITEKQHIPRKQYLSTPSPLNNWLWYITSGDDSGYYVSYRSVFDNSDSMNFTYFPKRDYLLNRIRLHEDVQDLIRFSQGYYTVEQWGDTLVFNDLRFGQIVGWHSPKERFAFHYYLSFPDNNTLVVQRGRFAKWNRETTATLIRRIMGN